MGMLDRLVDTVRGLLGGADERDRFAAEAMRVAGRLPGVEGTRFDKAQFAILVQLPGGGRPATVFLSNVYGECAGASREERRERLERLFRIMSTPHVDETWESVQAKLRPVLRPATFGQGGVPGTLPPISRAAMAFLRELVVVDHPEAMAYVGPKHLDDWHVSADEVFDTARANLDRIARDTLDRPWPMENALIRMIDTGDGYFTSLLLAPGWLAEVSLRMGQPTIAFVPDRNTVILSPIEGLVRLYQLVEEEYQDAVRGLSPVGYVDNGRGIVTAYVPVRDEADVIAARRAEVLLATAEYATQGQWLSAEYEKADIDVFVARLMSGTKVDTPAITVATWSDGLTTLLPKAQFIMFASDDERVGPVPWEVVAQLVDLRPEPLLAPERYRVTGWPPPAMMDRLRAETVDL